MSVLYHALQGSETYRQYIDDAGRAGDDELSSFFQDCQSEEDQRAIRARAMLASRLREEDQDEEEDEKEDEEE